MSSDNSFIRFCSYKGYPVSPDARILDFGCGAGGLVYKLIDDGFVNAEGYDVKDRPLQLRKEEDRSRFYISPEGIIPVPDNTYDYVFSTQVFEHVQDKKAAFDEIVRVLKPGGININLFPSNCRLLEPHTKIPLLNFKLFRVKPWILLWNLMGRRTAAQKGVSAQEAAQQNYDYIHSSVNYLSARQYNRVLSIYQITWSWEEVEFRLSLEGWRARWAKRTRLTVPILRVTDGFMRPFTSRVLMIRKNPN